MRLSILFVLFCYLFGVSVIEELHRFKNEHQIDASTFLDRNVKMVAFNFARPSNHPSFLKMMTSIFELARDKDMFIEKIRDILAEHNYKDVISIFYNHIRNCLDNKNVFISLLTRHVKLHTT